MLAAATCVQLIGGIQSFYYSYYYNNNNSNNNCRNSKREKVVWSQTADKSGDAILDLSSSSTTRSSRTSLLRDLATKNGEPSLSLPNMEKSAENFNDEGDGEVANTANGKETRNNCNNGVAVFLEGEAQKNIAKTPSSLSSDTSSSSTNKSTTNHDNNIDGGSTTTKTKIIATDTQFIKSLPDKRHYRAITLSNQLTVLLTSDPTTDVESASVHVRAGHFDDPKHRAGLAHFHEHVRIF